MTILSASQAIKQSADAITKTERASIRHLRRAPDCGHAYATFNSKTGRVVSKRRLCHRRNGCDYCRAVHEILELKNMTARLAEQSDFWVHEGPKAVVCKLIAGLRRLRSSGYPEAEYRWIARPGGDRLLVANVGIELADCVSPDTALALIRRALHELPTQRGRLVDGSHGWKRLRGTVPKREGEVSLGSAPNVEAVATVLVGVGVQVEAVKRSPDDDRIIALLATLPDSWRGPNGIAHLKELLRQCWRGWARSSKYQPPTKGIDEPAAGQAPSRASRTGEPPLAPTG